MTQPSPDLAVYRSAINTVTAAVDDPDNALGQPGGQARLECYRNLVPDLLTAAARLQKPTDNLSDLGQEQARQLAQHAAARAEVPPEEGHNIAHDVVAMLGSIVAAALSNASGVASLINAVRR